MSLLSRIFSRYKNNTPAAVDKAPSEQAVPLSYFPYLSLVKGFQLFTDLYSHKRDLPADCADIKRLAHIYKAQDNLVADHLMDTENTKVSDLCEYLRDDGSLLSYIEYSHRHDPENKNERPSQWASLMIAQLHQPEPGRILIDTQFVVSGFTTSVEGRSDLYFAPQVVLSRIHQNEMDQLVIPEDTSALIQSMAYGNQAFLQLIAGLPLDKLANQTWFESRRMDEAFDIFTELRGRTRQNIQQDITKLLDPSHELDRSKFGEFAPS